MKIELVKLPIPYDLRGPGWGFRLEVRKLDQEGAERVADLIGTMQVAGCYGANISSQEVLATAATFRKDWPDYRVMEFSVYYGAASARPVGPATKRRNQTATSCRQHTA